MNISSDDDTFLCILHVMVYLGQKFMHLVCFVCTWCVCGLWYVVLALYFYDLYRVLEFMYARVPCMGKIGETLSKFLGNFMEPYVVI